MSTPSLVDYWLCETCKASGPVPNTGEMAQDVFSYVCRIAKAHHTAAPDCPVEYRRLRVMAIAEALESMLSVIRGEGIFAHFGKGLSTYPDRDDDGKHEACLELERRGLIYRHLDEADHVVWMPVEARPALK